MNRCDRPCLTEAIKGRLPEKNLDKGLSLVTTRPQAVNDLQSAFSISGRAKVISITTVILRGQAVLRKQTTHEAMSADGAFHEGVVLDCAGHR